MKLNKKATLSLAAVLGIGAIAAIIGTTAYFTDTDTQTNTFTVGNVDIAVVESQLHRVNAGVQNGSTSTSPLWTPDQTMAGTADNTPDYTTGSGSWAQQFFSDEQIRTDATTYKATGGYYETNATNMVPGSSVRKNVYIDNIGTTSAYVRTRFLMPVSLFPVLDRASMWTGAAVKQGDNSTIMQSNAIRYYFDHDGDMSGYTTVTRNNIEYYEFDFTYLNPVAAGSMTFWSPWGNIALKTDVTSAELANVDSFDIIVEADAIQDTGFASAADAFVAFGN